jgi:hypothetical protein
MGGFMYEVKQVFFDNWYWFVGGGFVFAMMGFAAFKGKLQTICKTAWQAAVPLLVPLAVVGVLEVYNKMLVGSVYRPWIAVYEDRGYFDK